MANEPGDRAKPTRSRKHQVKAAAKKKAKLTSAPARPSPVQSESQAPDMDCEEDDDYVPDDEPPDTDSEYEEVHDSDGEAPGSDSPYEDVNIPTLCTEEGCGDYVSLQDVVEHYLTKHGDVS